MAHQIPACGITALGSSELLALHFHNTGFLFLEIMTDSWFSYSKVVYQGFKPFYIVDFALTAPV
jgi:hypothetical protein